MGKPSISMGFENRTTCCMLTPPHPPLLSSLPLTSPFPEPFAHPPLDTRADSFPRERCLRTVPNAFPSSDPGTQPSSPFHAESSNRYSSLRRYHLCTRITLSWKKKKRKKKKKKTSVDLRSAPLTSAFSLAFLPDFHGTLSDYEFLFEQYLSSHAV